jgi:hypothetical protein
MGRSQNAYKRLDSETLKEITSYVCAEFDRVQDENTKKKHDNIRANVKALLRNYRDIAKHVDEAIVNATQASHDIDLHDLLVLMGSSKQQFRAESIGENVAMARLLVNHIEKMIETYHVICEKSNKNEERRRFRVVQHLYISEDGMTAEEIANAENIDKATVYRDIDAAAEKLAVLLFGLHGVKLQ